MTRLLRYVWAAPTTVIGLVLAIASLRRGHVAIVDGVIEAHGPLFRRALASCTPLARGADAMTLGHVVIARDARALEVTRAHERVHVRQYELWGPFFLPVYLLAGAWALVRGGHPYFDNRFEREARLAEVARYDIPARFAEQSATIMGAFRRLASIQSKVWQAGRRALNVDKP